MVNVGVVVFVLLLVAAVACLAVVGYKWNQCKGVGVFTFPMTCSNAWVDNTEIRGFSLISFQNSSQGDCQTQCAKNSDCDVAQFYKSTKKCVLRSQKKSPENYCTGPNGDTQLFQKPGGAVPPKCSS